MNYPETQYGMTSTQSPDLLIPRLEYLKPDAKSNKQPTPTYDTTIFKISFLINNPETKTGALLVLAHMLHLRAGGTTVEEILNNYRVNGSVDYNPDRRNLNAAETQAVNLMQSRNTTTGAYSLLELLRMVKKNNLDIDGLLERVLLEIPEVAERFTTMREYKPNRR